MSQPADTLTLLGPFPLSGAGIYGQLDKAVEEVGRTLKRAWSNPRALPEACRRLEGRALSLAPWSTRAWFVIRHYQRELRIDGLYVAFGTDFATEDWPQLELEPPVVRPLAEVLTARSWWDTLQDFTSQQQWNPLLVLQWPHEITRLAGLPSSGAISLIALELSTRAGRHTSKVQLLRPELLLPVDGTPSTSRQPLEGLQGQQQAASIRSPEAKATVDWEAETEIRLFDDVHSEALAIPFEHWWTRARIAAEGAELSGTDDSNRLVRRPLDMASLVEVLAGCPRLQPPGIVMQTQFISSPSAPAASGDSVEPGWTPQLPAIEGWFSSALELRPQHPDHLAAICAGLDLGYRDLRSVQRARVLGTGTALLLSGLLSCLVAGVVWAFSQQESAPEEPAPLPIPVPALTFCSAENPAFVKALRHWLGYLRPDALTPESALKWDLSATWCGLLERESADGWNPGEQAAANACFEVLSGPVAYRWRDGEIEDDDPLSRAGVNWARLEAFFQGATRVPGLKSMVDDMRRSCTQVRGAEEPGLRARVVAAHVAPELMQEVSKLNDAGSASLARIADLDNGRAPAIWKQLRMIESEAAPASKLYQQPEEENGKLDDELWLSEYFHARFAAYEDQGQRSGLNRMGANPLKALSRATETVSFLKIPTVAQGSARLPSDALWSCYLSLLPDATYERMASPGTLDELRAVRSAHEVSWGLKMFYPSRLVARSKTDAVRSQLQLDAILTTFQEDESLASNPAQPLRCWTVVRDALQRVGYAPVHPLLEPSFEDWPSTTQQVCGQICQAYFGMETGKQRMSPASRAGWSAREADLIACRDPSLFMAENEPRKLPPLELDMRWYFDERSDWWTSASNEQVCAFHMLTQDRFPLSENQERATPLGDITTRTWAGGEASARETLSSASLLLRYARSTVRRGRDLPEVDGCRYAAVQCMTDGILVTMKVAQQDEWGRTPQRLRTLFRDSLGRGLREDGWCRLIDRDLRWLLENDFRLRDDVVESLCMTSIVQTHGRALGVIDRLARDQ